MEFRWYEDNYVIDPYNRHVADVPGYPDWTLRRKWDGSRDEVKIEFKGHHLGYVKENGESVMQFIDQYAKH